MLRKYLPSSGSRRHAAATPAPQTLPRQLPTLTAVKAKIVSSSETVLEIAVRKPKQTLTPRQTQQQKPQTRPLLSTAGVKTINQAAVQPSKVPPLTGIVPDVPLLVSEYFSMKGPEVIVKTSANDHHLTVIKSPRLRGQCVHCLQEKVAEGGKPLSRRTLTKIITYCPKCPGGVWMCEPCFDKVHPMEEAVSCETMAEAP